MCLMASNRTVASAFSGGGGDGEKNNLTDLKYTAQLLPAPHIVRLICCHRRRLLYYRLIFNCRLKNIARS